MIYNIIVHDNSGSVTDVISFSSVTNFNESYSSEVTENTVEFGFKISDHIVTKSPEITVEAMVSDYSIYTDELELYWDGDAFVNTAGIMGVTPNGEYLNAKQALKDIVQKRKLFTIIVSEEYVKLGDNNDIATNLEAIRLDKYTNCVMPSLSFPTRVGVKGVLFVNFTARQIRVAKTVVEDFDTKKLRLVEKVTQSTDPKSGLDKDGKKVGNGKDGKHEDKPLEKVYDEGICRDLDKALKKIVVLKSNKVDAEANESSKVLIEEFNEQARTNPSCKFTTL